MQRENRMKFELKQLRSNLPDGIICYQTDANDLCHWEAIIDGPPDSPYEGGRFKVDIGIPERYPFEPPMMKFITKIFHPNVDDSGRICLSAIQHPPKGTWKPALSTVTVLTSLRVLMSEPNPKDPLMADIAELFENNRAAFTKQARVWTDKYAKGTTTPPVRNNSNGSNNNNSSNN